MSKNVLIRLETLERRVQILEDLEKRLALAVVDVLPTHANNVSGYELTQIRTAMGARWVWKHFLRGSRSASTFETREACVKSAQADSMRHIAYPIKDFVHILNCNKEARRDRRHNDIGQRQTVETQSPSPA